MNNLQVGDTFIVPQYGPGIVESFHGRVEGLRCWLYVRVRFSPTLSALVPQYEGVVMQ